jgi:hypothetical protein
LLLLRSKYTRFCSTTVTESLTEEDILSVLCVRWSHVG